MTNKVQQTLLPIKLEQSEEKLTSLAGLIVFEEMARAKGLWEMVDEQFLAPGSGRGYKPSEFIKPLVWMLTAGGRSLEHMRELKAEQEVLSKLGLKRVPDAGTTGDWLRRQGSKGGTQVVERINEQMISQYLANQGEEITLDIDATIIEADKREAQWTYKKIRGYQPMMAYVNEVCVHSEFREGNESAGSKAIEFLEACEKKLPSGKRIYLKATALTTRARAKPAADRSRGIHPFRPRFPRRPMTRELFSFRAWMRDRIIWRLGPQWTGGLSRYKLVAAKDESTDSDPGTANPLTWTEEGRKKLHLLAESEGDEIELGKCQAITNYALKFSSQPSPPTPATPPGGSGIGGLHLPLTLKLSVLGYRRIPG